jgi:hypothetical protein
MLPHAAKGPDVACSSWVSKRSGGSRLGDAKQLLLLFQRDGPRGKQPLHRCLGLIVGPTYFDFPLALSPGVSLRREQQLTYTRSARYSSVS